jgi:hypothetical protein
MAFMASVCVERVGCLPLFITATVDMLVSTAMSETHENSPCFGTGRSFHLPLHLQHFRCHRLHPSTRLLYHRNSFAPKVWLSVMGTINQPNPIAFEVLK